MFQHVSGFFFVSGCFRSFWVVSFVSNSFQFVLVCVVVYGRARPSWLFYVAFVVTSKSGCSKLFHIFCVVSVRFLIVCSKLC